MKGDLKGVVSWRRNASW